MITSTGKVFIIIQVGAYMLVNGKMENKMVKVNLQVQMVQSMLDYLKTCKDMVKASLLIHLVRHILENG